MADLYEANLNGADLTGANQSGANLRSANLIGTRLPDGFQSDKQDEQIRHLMGLNIESLQLDDPDSVLCKKNMLS